MADRLFRDAEALAPCAGGITCAGSCCLDRCSKAPISRTAAGKEPGLIGLAGIRAELSVLLDGRPVISAEVSGFSATQKQSHIHRVNVNSHQSVFWLS